MSELECQLISVIVPVYKCEKFIARCIESILKQTYTNFELILVLDGEFDHSGDICRKFQAEDKRVIVLVQENQGVSVARNLGLSVSRGKWICFVDSDDWIVPDYLLTLISSAKESDDIVICDYFNDERGKSSSESFFSCDAKRFDNKDKLELLTNCLVTDSFGVKGSPTNAGVPWSKIYRANFLKKNNIEFVPGLKRMQDSIFNLYSYSYATTINYIKNPLYHYNRNEDSSTRRYIPDFDHISIRIIEEAQRFIKYRNIQSLDNVLNIKTYFLLRDILELKYVHPKCPMSLNRKRKEIIELLGNEPFQDRIHNLKPDRDFFTQKQLIEVFLIKHKMIMPVYLYHKYLLEHK